MSRDKPKKLKDKELFKTLEEVLDRSTLIALYELLNKGVIDVMHGAVASGKEARIYWAEDTEGNDLAVKIYLTSTAEFRKSRLRYIRGDRRFNGIRLSDIRNIVYAWCRKEYKNLRIAHEVGVKVPRPITFNKNVLVMEFISPLGLRGVPAPLIKDVPPDDVDALYAILDNIKRLYNEGRLIHADLSEYNVMNRDGEMVIIDWGSAVLSSHPNAIEFLRRDIRNIIKFFEKLGFSVQKSEEVLQDVVKAI